MGAHSSPLSKIPPAYSPPPPPFGCLQAGFLWIAVADNAAFLSTTFHLSPSLTGWSTHSAPGCTWHRGLRVDPHPGERLNDVRVSGVISRLPVARLPMVGPWFTSPWRLVFQSHGAVACILPLPARNTPLPYSISRVLLLLLSPPSACCPLVSTTLTPISSSLHFLSYSACFHPTGRQQRGAGSRTVSCRTHRLILHLSLCARHCTYSVSLPCHPSPISWTPPRAVPFPVSVLHPGPSPLVPVP